MRDLVEVFMRDLVSFLGSLMLCVLCIMTDGSSCESSCEGPLGITYSLGCCGYLI